MEGEDGLQVRYEKVLGNPGFMRCLQPECKDTPAIQAGHGFAHAWDEHKSVHISIEPPQKQEPQD